MSFRNRSEAGRKLAARLKSYRDRKPVILALPRGGVPVAAEVAAALNAPLDLVLVRKIGVPSQPELAMGAVVDGGSPIVIRNEDVIRLAGVDEAELQALRATRMREPKKLVLAVPVAPTDTLAAMQEEADEVICLEDHEIFGAIGYF